MSIIPVQSGSDGTLWTYHSKAGDIAIRPPVAEIDGEAIALRTVLSLERTTSVSPVLREDVYTGTIVDHPHLRLSLIARIATGSDVLRFHYHLTSTQANLLTKANGKDNFHLAAADVNPGATEVRLSDYNSLVHSYVPTEYEFSAADFADGRPCMGPMLVWPTDRGNAVLAYEHGSQHPDAYLSFVPGQSGERLSVTVAATKATYLANTDLRTGFDTVWMHVGMAEGPRSSLEAAYRDFLHRYQAVSNETRKPYIFNNTWNYQERIHFWENRPYLSEMNEERMLAEIDIAHQMGIEIFVLDTGWYDATGDWRVSTERFPNGLKPLNDRLDGYGMKLGLWFGPTTAALSSSLYKRNVSNLVTWDGKPAPTRKIWETEESAEFCLVSSYADDFAQELIRCARDFGVRYFKWDAVNQYECNDPGHQHGDESHSLEERAQRYAFCQPFALAKIVSTLCEAVPDAIVDFDVTEYDRCFGLAFLSVGKYFLLNNGPYIHNFDVPRDKDYSFFNNSLFFHPGPARDWILRTPYSFDTWIPSTLFLNHYLPDDPIVNQNMTVGSLVLGNNGIWGDLLGISKAGVQHLGDLLAPYKHVRDAAAAVAAHRVGRPGDMLETYEKINPATGRGLMVVFGNVTMQSAWGRKLTMRQPLEAEIPSRAIPSQSIWSTSNVKVSFNSDGNAVLRVSFETSDAAIVYFGVP